MKTPVSFFWLLLLIGDTELTKCWVLYDVDVKWLPGLTEDSEWQELSRSTSRSYSGSQGSVGITKVYNGPTYMPCINHIVAPVAHWGPRTLKIKSCTWRWYAVASGGPMTGDADSWSLNNVSIRTSWIWTASIMLILRCKILLSTPPSTDRWTDLMVCIIRPNNWFNGLLSPLVAIFDSRYRPRYHVWHHTTIGKW